MLAHATHVRKGEDGYGGYDDSWEEEFSKLRSVYAPNGAEVASDVDIDTDEILGYNVNKQDPDSEDEGEFTGNEDMPPTFRYHKTVIMLVPKDRLRMYLQKYSRFDDSVSRARNDSLAEMMFQDLANHRHDTNTKQAATDFMNEILHCIIKPQGPTVGLISRWALELNNIAMFHNCVRATYAPLDSRPSVVDDSPLPTYREAISTELVKHLRTHYNGQEQDIDWDYWYAKLTSFRLDIHKTDADIPGSKISTGLMT